MRALTHALTQDATAEAALDELRDSTDPVAIEALVEVLARPHCAPLAVAAVEAVASIDTPLTTQALIDALDSPLATVRTIAAQALGKRGVGHARSRLIRLLCEDESWPARRAALQALETACWAAILVTDDPHWRVRHALVQVLLGWGVTRELKDELIRHLREDRPAHPRNEGIRAYLAWRWGDPILNSPTPNLPPASPLSDSDPFVSTRELEALGEDGRRLHLDSMPAILTHDSHRARSLARQTLARYGETDHLVAAVARLNDPREGAAGEVDQLMRSIERDRVESAARRILHWSEASPAQRAWAVAEAGESFPIEEEAATLERLFESACAVVGCDARARPLTLNGYIALARLARRWPTDQALLWLESFAQDVYPIIQAEALRAFGARNTSPKGDSTCYLACSDALVRAAAVACLDLPADLSPFAHDEDASVRIALAQRLRATESAILDVLARDPHPLVRAAALTPERASALVAAPEQETSWHVIHTAARMAKVPAWNLEPKPPWQPPARTISAPEPLSVSLGTTPNVRTLGPEKLSVPPIGLSGHYGLPVEGFARAVERGLNCLFWEPNYLTLTSFAARLAPSSRQRLNVLAGTFEATPKGCVRDVERALSHLKIERLALFLVFWVRGWSRITDDMRTTLDRLKRDGKVGMVSLSTHDRSLAVEAIEEGWDPIMVRHSLAHRGAESEIFPKALARGTSVITFNNTCYGRLLKPLGDRPAPTAADCYRFSLSQPGVTMCLSAPANLDQLEETLQVATDPALPPERLFWLTEHGAEVYREETMFRRTIRAL